MSLRAAASCRVVVTLLAGLALASPRAARAQRQLFDRFTDVGVHVIGVPDEARQLGVDSIDLRRHLEARLRGVGIGVRSGAELAAFQDTPRLVIVVSALTVDSAYFFSVTAELLERVALKRTGGEMYGYNWTRQAIGAATLERAMTATWGAVDQLTSHFLEARRRAMALAQAPSQ